MPGAALWPANDDGTRIPSTSPLLPESMEPSVRIQVRHVPVALEPADGQVGPGDAGPLAPFSVRSASA